MSVVFEIVGFLLALIEIYWPRRAEKLERWLDSLPKHAWAIYEVALRWSHEVTTKISRSQKKTFKDSASGYGILLSSTLDVLDVKNIQNIFIFHLLNILIVLCTACFVVFCMLLLAMVLTALTTWSVDIEYIYKRALDIDLAKYIIFTTLLGGLFLIALNLIPLALGVFIWAFVVLAKAVIHGLNWLTRGRAIGAIGLIIGAYGLLTRFL